MNNYQRTASWLHACGKIKGDNSHISTQIGCDLEEIAEWIDCLRVSSDDWDEVRRRIMRDLSSLSSGLKSGKIISHIPQHMRVAALDALCDREVTANGVAYLSGFMKDEADRRVLNSNDSKLNADGTAVILPGGKIGKSSLYQAPDLRECV